MTKLLAGKWDVHEIAAMILIADNVSVPEADTIWAKMKAEGTWPKDYDPVYLSSNGNQYELDPEKWMPDIRQIPEEMEDEE